MEVVNCGTCKDYYVCKADMKHIHNKYLPKNKKACGEHVTLKDYLGEYKCQH